MSHLGLNMLIKYFSFDNLTLTIEFKKWKNRKFKLEFTACILDAIVKLANP